MKVRGIEHKTGTFEDKTGRQIAYDNYYLHCTKGAEENPGTMTEGTSVEVVKVSAPVYAGTLAAHNVQTLCGCVVFPRYDRWGKVTGFDVQQNVK